MSKAKGQSQEPMSTHQFFSILGGAAVILLTIWLIKHESDIKYWIFTHWTRIGAVGFLIFTGLIQLIRWKVRGSEKSKRIELLSNIWNESDGVFIGKTPDGCEIHIPDKTRTGHVQILGATGRGKTESVILPWLIRDLWRGHSTILIDGKGERSLLNRLTPFLEHVPGKPKLMVFDLGNPKDSLKINPLKVGTPQQITDRLFQSFEFSDPFYQAVQFEIAGHLIELIHEAEGVVTFKSLYKVLTEDSALSESIGKSKNQPLQTKLSQFLTEPRKDRDVKVKGLVAQLTPFATGELASLVNGGEDEFSLAELLTGNEHYAAVVLLPTLLYQQMATKLGKLLLQEVAWAVAARKRAEFTPIFLDEFSAFVYEGFSQILNKARSSGIALHLSHQSIGDLESVSSGFATVVNANTNVKCLLGLNDPTTADFFAKHLGTEEQEKVTERARKGALWGQSARTGDLSVREVEAYRIHPNELKHLMNGDGVVQFAIPEGTVLERVKFARLPEAI